MEINTNYRNTTVGSNKVPYSTKEKSFANNLDEKVKPPESSVASSDEKPNPSGLSVADSYDISKVSSYTNKHLVLHISKLIYEDENYRVYGPDPNGPDSNGHDSNDSDFDFQHKLDATITIENKRDWSVVYLEDLNNPKQFTQSFLSYMNENKLNFEQLEKHVIENKFNSLQEDNLFYDFVKSIGEVQIRRQEYTVIVDHYD